MPDLFLAGSTIMLVVAPTQASAIAVCMASILWGFHYYFSKPVPPTVVQDDTRVEKCEEALKKLEQKIESVQAAANLRNLR